MLGGRVPGVEKWGPGEPRGGDCMAQVEGVWRAKDCLNTDTPMAFLAEKVYPGDS